MELNSQWDNWCGIEFSSGELVWNSILKWGIGAEFNSQHENLLDLNSQGDNWCGIEFSSGELVGKFSAGELMWN